ncbi:MAG: GNAT family N-acetyltransferase [Anaerolineae bacterium]
MNVIIRTATEADQPTITSIIRAAHINPMDLKWQHFVVAEDAGQIVGTGQIKTHRDGSHELASIAVIPERQGEGVASQIITTLLADQSGTLYLMCQRSLEPFYQRFGFSPVTSDQMPPYFRRITKLAGVLSPVSQAVRGEGLNISVMKRKL